MKITLVLASAAFCEVVKERMSNGQARKVWEWHLNLYSFTRLCVTYFCFYTYLQKMYNRRRTRGADHTHAYM
jgi:hypothetical protein